MISAALKERLTFFITVREKTNKRVFQILSAKIARGICDSSSMSPNIAECSLLQFRSCKIFDRTDGSKTIIEVKVNKRMP